MDLSIGIVSYNVRDCLHPCLESIRACAKGLTVEVSVVDNASVDGSAAMIRLEFPEVRLVESPVNLGFGKGMNLALSEASGRYVLLLNPDTRLTENALCQMMRYLETHPQCGIVGPRLLNGDGSVQNGLRRFPDPWTLLVKDTFLRKTRLFQKQINRYRMRNYPLHETGKVDQVSGAAMMLSCAAWQKLGGLDERFFIFFEEVDLCRRAVFEGWEAHYYAEPVIVHTGGQSRLPENSKANYYRLESQIKYLKKYMAPSAYFPYLVIFKGLYLLSLLGACLGDKVASLLSCTFRYCYPASKDRRRVSREHKAAFRRFFLKEKLVSFIKLH